MSDIKKNVKAIVKIYVQIFVSTLIQVSTKQIIKNLSNLHKKRFEAKVRYMSDDQLAQYFEENPYFGSLLQRTINPGYDFQPVKRKESVIGKLISIFEEINYFNNPINALLLPTRGAIFTAMLIILITSAASVGIVTSLPPVLPPVANFTSNITNGEVPLVVQFNDTSTGGKPILWYWDFGDNESSTDRNLTHTYNSAGNYTVKLKLINIKGLDSKNTTITVLKLKPKITWSNPADITYGTVLNDTQLNAFVTYPVTGKNITGNFTYNPENETKLSAGTHILDVKFTPVDIAIYTNESFNVTINVSKARPRINWTDPTNITYGTVLNGTQLNAIVSDLSGNNITDKFTYNPGNGTILSAGTHTLYVEFSPYDIANYTNESDEVTINVSKACPITNWNNLSDIVYGTPLSKTQLNATANVNGTFNYNPTEGTVLEKGSKTLNATFIPTDTKNYTNVSLNVSINVKVAESDVNWDNPDDIIYGTSLSASQLNAWANVPGNFTYYPARDTKLSAGKHTLHVDFTPYDVTNYTNESKSVTINITKVTPEINWSKPADITYGTALNSTQLNAKANVDGTFNYTLVDGTKIVEGVTILNAGNNTLYVNFTPTDSTNYTMPSKPVKINVLKVYAYVTNEDSNSVSVIDISTNEVNTTVPVGECPVGVAVTPDGTKVYVTNFRSKTVSVIDTATNTVKDTIRVTNCPVGIAVSRDGKFVYVIDGLLELYKINTAEDEIEYHLVVGYGDDAIKDGIVPNYWDLDVYLTEIHKSIFGIHFDKNEFFSLAFGLAVSPDGRYVYLTRVGYVSIIDTYTNEYRRVTVEKSPIGVAVSPNGEYVYVTDLCSTNVFVIDTITYENSTITVRDGTFGVAVSPDGTKVYVTHPTDSSVSVINTAIKKVISNVHVGKDPRGVAITPDGRYVYVANYGDDTISVIDTTNNKVIDTIKVGKRPVAFGQFIGKLPIDTTAMNT